jgi:hypothetical protein
LLARQNDHRRGILQPREKGLELERAIRRPQGIEVFQKENRFLKVCFAKQEAQDGLELPGNGGGSAQCAVKSDTFSLTARLAAAAVLAPSSGPSK